jgi:hypothetical protein
MSSLYYSGDTGTNRGTSLRRPFDARCRAQIRSDVSRQAAEDLAAEEPAQVERRDPLSRDIQAPVGAFHGPFWWNTGAASPASQSSIVHKPSPPVTRQGVLPRPKNPASYVCPHRAAPRVTCKKVKRAHSSSHISRSSSSSLPPWASSALGAAALPALPDIRVMPRLLNASLAVLCAYASLEMVHETPRTIFAQEGTNNMHMHQQKYTRLNYGLVK